jgi:hypothetical protein
LQTIEHMKKLTTSLSLILILVTVILIACSEATPTPSPTPEATERPVSQATESPLAMPESPLAGPESPLATPVRAAAIKPEMTASTGAVIGTIRIRSASVDKPVANTKVALAPVIQPESGAPRATGYDPANAPQTTSDAEGNFAINTVEPGLYGIIVDGVTAAVMLVDPATDESIIVDVKASEAVDVGLLEYESLEIPGYQQ